ncbi:hypothetical protein ACRAWD_03375 [Caulobacter segnis]
MLEARLPRGSAQRGLLLSGRPIAVRRAPGFYGEVPPCGRPWFLKIDGEIVVEGPGAKMSFHQGVFAHKWGVLPECLSLTKPQKKATHKKKKKKNTPSEGDHLG